MTLSIEAYNAAERAAMEILPNRITEACRPELFLKVGYPVEVSSDAGLGRFVDVMHESRDESDYKELLNGFTADEFELFKEVSAKTCELAQKRFGVRMVPKGALTRAMLSFRHIRMLAPPGAAIFEVGPGSGYLGALLATAGYRYGATDIAQGFYLYQNRLWEQLFGSRLIELAESEALFEGFGDMPAGAVVHVPWWKYTTLQAERVNTPIDIYVANHALNEMNLYSMCYTIRLSHQLLSKSERYGYFFIENTGGETLRTRATTFHYLQTNKFERAFEDGGLIDVLVPSARMESLRANAEPALQPQQAAQPAPAPAEAPGLPTRVHRQYEYLRRAVSTHGGVVKTTLKVLNRPSRLLRMAPQVSGASVTPAPAETRIHRQIVDGRAATAAQPKIAFETVRQFQREQLGGSDIRSGDERFFHYVFGTDFYS